MTDNEKQDIILASASPRRREILGNMGLKFEIIKSDAEPELEETDDPVTAAEKSALAKAKDIAKSHPDKVIISADTVVAVDGILLGKPKDEDDAARMLRLISGRTHSVITAVCVIRDGKCEVFSEKSDVRVATLTDTEIQHYIATGEPMDKAGAYAIQGKFMIYVERIEGDFYNIMGFPASKFYAMYRWLF